MNKRLEDLNPRWGRLYRDRHLTPDNGGFPTDDYGLSFDCPACGAPCRVSINIGPVQNTKGPTWQATPLPDGPDWPSRVSIAPSINYTTAGHGRKRPPCTFHGTITNGEVFPS